MPNDSISTNERTPYIRKRYHKKEKNSATATNKPFMLILFVPFKSIRFYTSHGNSEDDSIRRYDKFLDYAKEKGLPWLNC